MNSSSPSTLIIGAGLSGLACALELHQAGKPFRILEKSDSPGGRVRTDEVNGFLLDRGFQVYLDAYPTTGNLLDYEALNLKAFEPGALIFKENNSKPTRLMDPFRRPSALPASLLNSIGTIFDKMRVSLLRQKIGTSPLDVTSQEEFKTTEKFLADFGFSPSIIDQFFRSFYGGIFLERELQTNSYFFEFTFKMFTRGHATIPARGMGEIPKQLASRLPSECFLFNTTVTDIRNNCVQTSKGETIITDQIVVAAPGIHAKEFLPDLSFPKMNWQSTTNLYFAAPTSPLNEPIIALTGSENSLINSVACLTDLSPDLSPDNRALLSVTLIGIPDLDDTNLQAQARKELSCWFGNEVAEWEHLCTYRIPHALPCHSVKTNQTVKIPDNIHLCGDYLETASIEGAICSGQAVAKKIVAIT